MMQDRLPLIATVITGMVLLVGISITMLLHEARRRDLAARVVQTVAGTVEAAETQAFSGLVGYLHRLGKRLLLSGRFYKEKDLEHLQSLIAAAGYNTRELLPLLVGAKLALMLALPALTAVLASLFLPTPTARLAAIGLALVLGMMGPDVVLSRLRQSHIAALEKATPDALDLLVICSEAGMGLDSALERVSRELRRSNRPMAMALSGLVEDMNVLPDRREAIQNFARRCGVEGLQRLATMLSQALQLGTPIGQALRSVAIELRRERANKLEEKAVKLPAKLIFPLILFIMPSLYIVLLGPSFMRLFGVLGTFVERLPNH